MDIGGVTRVIQYMLPSNLMQWKQHAGRCGRAGASGLAILIVEYTVFQMMRKRKQNFTDNKVSRKHKKTADETPDQNIKTEEIEDPVIPSDDERQPSEIEDQEPEDQEQDDGEDTQPLEDNHAQDNEVTQDLTADVNSKAGVEDSGGIADKDEGESELQARKNVDAKMREYVETQECRDIIIDEYFDNPPDVIGE